MSNSLTANKFQTRVWCRTHELGKINPTPFVPFSASRGDGLRGLFRDLPVLCTRARYALYVSLRIPVYGECGEAPQKDSCSPGQGSGALAVPAAVHPCAAGEASVPERAASAASGVAGGAASQNGARPPLGRDSRSAGVQANLVCRRFYKVRK